jgi:hypothetical protein
MNNRKKQFEELCEAFGVIETKKRMMYPRGIQFSEQFLQALQEEYERQKLEESQKEKPIREHSSKMLKALQFHIRALDNEQVGLAETEKKAHKAYPMDKDEPGSHKRNRHGGPMVDTRDEFIGKMKGKQRDFLKSKDAKYKQANQVEEAKLYKNQKIGKIQEEEEKDSKKEKKKAPTKRTYSGRNYGNFSKAEADWEDNTYVDRRGRTRRINKD